MILNDETLIHLAAHHRNFEEFAEQMMKTHAGRFDEEFWGLVSRAFGASPGSIVDFGTGPGLLLMDLAKKYPHARIFGVEAQPSMLKRARAVIRPSEPRVRLLEHDLASPPVSALPDAKADAAIASMLLHEMPVPTLLIDEAWRILKPGGAFIVYDWVRQPFSSYFEGKRPTTLDEFTHFSEHCRYTPEDWCWLLESSGFSVSECLPRQNGRHTLISARKMT